MSASANLTRLMEYLSAHAPKGMCVAFSGGVDSSLLLAACAKAGAPLLAVTIHSPLHSPGEPGEAGAIAAAFGVQHRVLILPEIPENIRYNPPDRCYLCKKELFGQILDLAGKEGLSSVLDGTNADDLNVYRPGLTALRELGILSPLAELGFSKAQVREMAKEMGLQAADKPSAPCMATRFPYGARLTREAMEKAERIESAVKALDVNVVRARIHGDTVRLEAEPESFDKLIAARQELAVLCKSLGFLYVTMDLEGFRSGSMDIALGKQEGVL